MSTTYRCYVPAVDWDAGRDVARTLAAAVLALSATAVQAHSEAGLSGGFASGFSHPLGGLDPALAMVAVGVWGAFLARPLVYVLPMVFPAMMAVGGVLGMAGFAMPPVELGIAVSVIVLGLLILLAVHWPIWAACLVVGTFALFHGYAHGAELPLTADPLGYSLGFVVATGLLHVAGIGLGRLQNLRYGRALLRGAGGAVALAGCWFAAGALGR